MPSEKEIQEWVKKIEEKEREVSAKFDDPQFSSESLSTFQKQLTGLKELKERVRRGDFQSTPYEKNYRYSGGKRYEVTDAEMDEIMNSFTDEQIEAMERWAEVLDAEDAALNEEEKMERKRELLKRQDAYKKEWQREKIAKTTNQPQRFLWLTAGVVIGFGFFLGIARLDKYPSMVEAEKACNKWVKEGGIYKFDFRDYPISGKGTHIGKARRCEADKETRQFIGRQLPIIPGKHYSADERAEHVMEWTKIDEEGGEIEAIKKRFRY